MLSAPVPSQIVNVRWLGSQNYLKTWDAMKAFTQMRDSDTIDEIWLLEHEPVYTQGQNGKPEHILNPGDIPIVKTDRGGQVTYHGPGQLMIYILMDLKRKKFSIRDLVSNLELTIIDFLQTLSITAFAKREAPGIYLAEHRKIASIGLRIKRGCAYHGLAFNIDLDLAPFSQINPCGFANLQMTTLALHTQKAEDTQNIASVLYPFLLKHLDYQYGIRCD
ncbi:MAG: lipoyl(octanoyl) transferase LipB [Gammaproteobacteria bacterium]|nr:lipoyl(octanoyl) transferase LipB [Gammaproteobacteria bacterium]